MSTKVDWPAQVLEQLDFYWPLLRGRLDGLTDEEYFWEPVPGCWTVRRVADGFAVDFAYPPPDPPPFTTIAWRLCHVAGAVFGLRASNHFGDGSYQLDHHDYPGTAKECLDYLDEQHARWREGIGTLGEAGMARPVGAAEGPFAESPYAVLILHLNREVFHHGGEACLLRDLHRAGGGGTLGG